jgi:hypothetical protein
MYAKSRETPGSHGPYMKFNECLLYLIAIDSTLNHTCTGIAAHVVFEYFELPGFGADVETACLATRFCLCIFPYWRERFSSRTAMIGLLVPEEM